MKKSRLSRRRELEQKGKVVEFARVDAEFVTDDILQVLVHVTVTDEAFEEAAWLLAHAIDVVALEFDRRLPPSFKAFEYSFSAARSMIKARPVKKRRDAADIRNIPAFLGGSFDPT